MLQRLGVIPTSLAVGLAQTFAVPASKVSAALRDVVRHDA
jgi:hypothetical protein